MIVTSTTDQRHTIQLPIDGGVLSLRGLSPRRHRFELEYALERGSTANSFLFEADDDHPAVLVHPPERRTATCFFQRLQTSCRTVTSRFGSLSAM